MPPAGIGYHDGSIFAYAMLHDPVYRETYAINLKQEFPRIPFYPDWSWSSPGFSHFPAMLCSPNCRITLSELLEHFS